MDPIVNFVDQHAVTTSQVVAKLFTVPHHLVMRRISEVLADYPDILSDAKGDEYVRFTEVSNRGLKFKAAEFNREFFGLLMLRFEAAQAREMQRRFTHAFFAMEKRLLQAEANRGNQAWLASRDSGKIGRKEETDVIKEFVDYATAQGSKNANFYYTNITMATYRALELLVQRQPKLRDTLSGYELAELLLAERLVLRKLAEYMALGRNYKDIYSSVTADLHAYASAVRFPSKIV